MQNQTGEAAYGLYFSLFSFSVLFTLVLDMGLSGFNNREVSADPSRVRLYFGNVLLLRLLLTLAYFSVTALVAWAIGYSARQMSLLAVLMANQVMASFTLWLRSNISGMQYLFLDSILSVSDRLIMIILCSLILWGGVISGPFRIEWFIFVQTAAYFSVMIVSFVIVIRRGGISDIKPDLKVLRGIIISGLPYAFVAFAMTLYWRSDTVLIERLLPDGAVQAGNYAQAFRLFDAFYMIPVMFGSLLLPIFSREYSAGRDISPLASMASKMLTIPVGIIAVIAATFPDEILDMLYVSPTMSSAEAFRILMITMFPVGLTYIYSTLLTAAGDMRRLGIIMGTGMVLNIAAKMVLIPEYSCAGAAIAALMTQTLVALSCVYAVHRKMFPVVRWKNVFLYLSMLAALISAGFILRALEMRWLPAAALQLAVGVIWALAFRMIEPVKSIKLIAERRDYI